MYSKKLALTASALAATLSTAPASAFFIDDFGEPVQSTSETNGSNMGNNNPTTGVAASGSLDIWAEREVDIMLVRGATSNRREALANISNPDPIFDFSADSGVQANYNVTYSGRELDTGYDFTEGYVLDHIAIDVVELDILERDNATVSIEVRLTDLDGNRFTVSRNATEVFDAQGGQVFYNLEEYDLGGVNLTEINEVRMRVLSGSTARDGKLDNFRVVDRIPVPGSLLLLLPALALVKRRKA